MPPRTTAEAPGTDVSAPVSRPPVSDSAAASVAPDSVSRAMIAVARAAARPSSGPAALAAVTHPPCPGAPGRAAAFAALESLRVR